VAHIFHPATFAVAWTVTHAPLVASDKLQDASRDAADKLRLERHANPTLAGGSDDEAARIERCGQERLTTRPTAEE